MSLSALTWDFPASTLGWIILIGMLIAIYRVLSVGASPLAGLLGAAVGFVGYGVDRHLYLAVSMLVVGILLCVTGCGDPRLAHSRYLLPQIGFVVIGWTVYEYLRDVSEGTLELAMSNSTRVLDLEQRLGLHIEPDIQEWVMQSDRAISLLSRLYSSMYLPFVLGTVVWFLVTNEFPFKVLRNTLMISAGLSVLTFWLFPVAPPRMVPEAGVIDFHTIVGRAHGFMNEFAAVPSLHVGWTILCCFIIASWYREHRWITLVWLQALIMLFVVVATGNHYWMDGLIGALYVLVPGLILFHWPAIHGWWRTWMSPDRYRVHDTIFESVRASGWALLTWSTLGLLLAILLVGQFLRPGFTSYWGYMVFQIAATILLVGILTHTFEREGGLSWITHLIIIGVTYADTLGTAADFYDKYNFFDKVTHIAGGMVLSATMFEILQALSIRGGVDLSLWWRSLISIGFAVFLGGMWEFYELWGDALFDTGRHAGMLDTTYDMISDTIGAVAAVVLLVVLMPFRSQVIRTREDRPPGVSQRTPATENV